jgi:Uma2 family endonuclease
MPLPEEHDRFSYEDYQTWPYDERWEILDGKAYNMTPAPTTRHQRIVGNIYHILRKLLRGGRCLPGIAPTDVVLSDYDVVQPDVFVVCDPLKVSEKNIQGAPDLIVEVISPATARKDRWEKKDLYERSGVLEYLLVDPDGEYVERYFLEKGGRFDRGEVFSSGEILLLRSIEHVEIPLLEVFEVRISNHE